jgi:RNA polymerase sigma factor (sigma-70 family)
MHRSGRGEPWLAVWYWAVMGRMAWLNSTRGSGTTAPADAAEFDRLLREHVPALYRSAYRWTGAADRAEDLVQELLLRLYPRTAELRELDRIRPWALRVMYRIFVDQLRRERSSPVQFQAGQNADEARDEDAVADVAAELPELVDQQLTQDRILQVWPQLGEEHRVVLSMHDIEDYTLPELAEMLDVPIGTLKSRLHRARTRLRNLLCRERISVVDRV